MSDNIIKMNQNSVIEFMQKNIGDVSSCDDKKKFIEAILKIIHLLNNYEEEGQKIKFKLAVGIDTDVDNLEGRFHLLQQYDYTGVDVHNDLTERIFIMIKKVAVFCSRYADMYIVMKDQRIKCGVYFTDLEKTGDSEYQLLHNKFIIFENILPNLIYAQIENDIISLCFDFDTPYNMQKTNKNYHEDKATICKTWDGIFQKVKKTVHGTICLVVSDKWHACDDKNFTGEINELEIKLSRENQTSADSFQDYENKLDLFFSMLSYDGITIIDTKENIRAYNIFCKISDEQKNTEGGARHRAYDSLKNLGDENAEGYVAVYFQSQDGDTKFYNFITKEEMIDFDSSIMNDGSNNRYHNLVKGIQQKYNGLDNIEEEDLAKYNHLSKCIKELKDAHDGIDNFYNEPKPAEELCELLSENNYIELIKKYKQVAVKLINVVFECIIGNSYGFSRKAQEPLNNIIELIDAELWKYFFENECYIDNDLAWGLSYEKLFKRWEYKLNEIFERYPIVSGYYNNNYSSKNFEEIYKAFQELQNNI